MSSPKTPRTSRPAVLDITSSTGRSRRQQGLSPARFSHDDDLEVSHVSPLASLSASRLNEHATVNTTSPHKHFSSFAALPGSERDQENASVFDEDLADVVNHFLNFESGGHEQTDNNQAAGTKRKRSSSIEMEMPPSDFLARNPELRHPNCAGGQIPCTHSAVSYTLHAPAVGRSRIAGTVYRETRFGPAEATIEQIRYIISRCTCIYAAVFHEAWENYCRATEAQGRRRNHACKESYISTQFSPWLNGVINEFCLQDPAKAGSSETNPICFSP